MAIDQTSIEVSIEIATREVFSMNTADGVDGFRSTTCPLHGLPKRYQSQAIHQKGKRMERADGRRGFVGLDIAVHDSLLCGRSVIFCGRGKNRTMLLRSLYWSNILILTLDPTAGCCPA